MNNLSKDGRNLKLYYRVVLFVALSCYLVSLFGDVIPSPKFADVTYWVLLFLVLLVFVKSMYFHEEIKVKCQEVIGRGEERFILRRPTLLILILLPIEVFVFFVFLTDTIPIVSSWVAGEKAEHALMVAGARRSRKAELFCPGYFTVIDYKSEYKKSHVCANSKTFWRFIRSKRRLNPHCRILATGTETFLGFVPYRFEQIKGPTPEKGPSNC